MIFIYVESYIYVPFAPFSDTKIHIKYIFFILYNTYVYIIFIHVESHIYIYVPSALFSGTSIRIEYVYFVFV